MSKPEFKQGDKVVWKGMLYGVSYQEPISKRVRISGLGVASTATVDPDELYASMDEWKAAQGKPTAPKAEVKPESKPVQRITVPKQVSASKIIAPMSKAEAQLAVLNIKNDMAKVGDLVLDLYEREGWKALGYTSWRDCAAKELDFSQGHAYRLLEFARVERNISPIGEKLAEPLKESQARELAKVPDEQQAPILEKAIETAPDGKLTAQHIRRTVEVETTQVETKTETKIDYIDPDTGEILHREAPINAQPEQNTGRQKPKSNAVGEHTDDQPDPRDRCQTPDYAIDPLIQYLRRDSTLWECAYGEGRLGDALFDCGFEKLISSDLLTGQDFLKGYTPAEEWDVLVTNPPYSTKYDWLARCYELGKPFALLMPIDTLGSKQAQDLFRKCGIEVIFMNQRVDFKMPEKGWGGSGAQFSSAWFCWQLGIGREMTFADISAAKEAFKKDLQEANEDE